MPYSDSIAIFLVGFSSGFLFCLFFANIIRSKTSSQLKEIVDQNEQRQKEQLTSLLDNLKSNLQSQSFQNLSQTTQSMANITKDQILLGQSLIAKELDGNKSYINDHIGHLNEKLQQIFHLVASLEKDRQGKFSELTSLIDQTNKQTGNLISTTSSIKEILFSSQHRGQLGEEIADDILNLIGFMENIHYAKQKTTPDGLRPDFTFYLPKNLILHMDVKFPITNYRNYMQSQKGLEKERFKKSFEQDLKNILKDLSSKNYINENTVDCLLLFIPNEAIFSHIAQFHSDLFQLALKKGIIFCSPLNLFAILSVIKKSIEHFKISTTSTEIIELVSLFKKQWEMFSDNFLTIEKKISELQKEFEKLRAIRTNKLETIMQKIEDRNSF